MDRFAAMGSDSRLGIWSEAIKILQRTPDGHGIRQLQSHEWAHNLFLDVGLTDGWIAIVAMVLLYGGAFFLAWRCVRTANFFDSGANVIMFGWLMASFVASMILPPQLAFLATMHISLGFFAPYRVPALAAKPEWPEMRQPARMAY
jgi:O-antigen ligase